MNRRHPAQVASDRADLLDSIPTDRWVRVPANAHDTDVIALIRSGDLDVEVRREFDPQVGNYSHAYFGGAGVVLRRRRYIRRSNTNNQS